MPASVWLAMTWRVVVHALRRERGLGIRAWWTITKDVWFGWAFNWVMEIIFKFTRGRK